MSDDRFNISEYLLDRHVLSGRGSSPAYVSSETGEVAYTYEALLAEVERVGSALIDNGPGGSLSIRREERIGLMLRDRHEFVVLFLASARVGAVPVLLNPDLDPGSALGLADQCGMRVVFVDADLPQGEMEERAAATGATRVVRVPSEEWSAILRGGEATAAAPRPSVLCRSTAADSPCYFLCTSGTTGLPKLVMHRHATLRIISEGYGTRVLGHSASDRSFSVAPLFHAYGLGNSVAFPLGAGGSAVLYRPRPADPLEVGRVVVRTQPTIFYHVPTGYAALLGAGLGREEFGTVRKAVTAGEACPADIEERAAEQLGLTLSDGVGATEMGHIYLSDGFVVPGYALQLRDRDTGEVIAADDGREDGGGGMELGALVEGIEMSRRQARRGRRSTYCSKGIAVDEALASGELYIGGDAMAYGYYARYGKSRDAFLGQWYKSGDVFSVDAATGKWMHSGRDDDMMKVAGEWVSPLQVENAVCSHPSVAESCVIGQPAGNSGLVVPVALVVLSAEASGDPLTEVEIGAHCRKIDLPSHMVPHTVYVVPEFPKTPIGKINKKALRALAKKLREDASNATASKNLDPAEQAHQFRAILKEIAGVDPGSSETLAANGVDSATVSLLSGCVERNLGLKIPQSLMFAAPVAVIVEFVASGGEAAAAEAVDWAAETELPALLPRPTSDPIVGGFQLPPAFSVLLTGATGYLGGYILKALLALPSISTVYVLVRDPQRAAAGGLADDGRVVLVAGDCGKDRLGMAQEDWDTVAREASVVIHNAAVVSWIKPHASLRAVNVGGTQQCIRMCADGGRAKRLVYVSSISAYLGQEQSMQGMEEPRFSFIDGAAIEAMGGYGSTKRVSEELVLRAKESGVLPSACVVRPGTISGATADGHSNPSDTFNCFLMAMCKLGAGPDLGEGAKVTMVPVDHVADIIARVMVADESELSAGYTIVGDEGILMEDILTVCGEEQEGGAGAIERVSLQAFLQRVMEDKNNPMAPLVRFFEGDVLPVRDEGVVFPHANKQAVCQKAGSEGCGVGISGSELIRKYIQFMQRGAAGPNPILLPRGDDREALIIIDMQNDFIDGSLTVPDANSIIPVINKLRSQRRFDLTIFTADRHAPNHISFASNHNGYNSFESKQIKYTHNEKLCGAEHAALYGENATAKDDPDVVTVFQQVLWPDHCIQDTRGADYHGELDKGAAFSLEPVFIDKGINEHIDSYSCVFNVAGTSDTNIGAMLAAEGISSVFVVGLALDFCVKYSAIDLASKLRLKTTVLLDATKGIADASIKKAMPEMTEAGVRFGQTVDLL